MNIQVKLKDIIEEIEIQFEESRSFLNIKTGEIMLVTSDNSVEVKFFHHLQENRRQMLVRRFLLIVWNVKEKISCIKLIPFYHLF